jgi:hypothetical protein
MRFDEFLDRNGLSVEAIDQFDGYFVEVAVPLGWEAAASAAATRVWIWRDDPCREQLCANAVLTLSRVEAVLDPAEVLSMLCDGQAQLLPGIHEVHRESSVAAEGPGVRGILALVINTDIGVLECVVAARIIAADQQTLIAQLTVTALPESPVDPSAIGFGVVPAAWAGPAPTRFHGAAPSDTAEAL